ncbi:hypothetical protein [Janthinobacterium sp. MDB2-8]|uniref:hypothetical protein n=1 Tax=Janthinobacterium sp. MDB2-8 TaxID=1259338 RepID=UPI003F27BBF9
MSTFFSFLMLLFLATGTGYILLTKSMQSLHGAPFSLRIGAAYFTGLAFYIVLIRTFSSLLGHADWAVWCTIATACGLCLYFHRLLLILITEFFSKKGALGVIFGLLIFSPIFLVYWMPGGQSVDNPFSFMGSLHSIRYAWIANFISACGVVPVIGQNTGQSMLTYMAGSLSGSKPYVFLYFWLCSSLMFLSVFLYGFISLYESRWRLALCATVMVMFGNSALSLTHVLTIDSGSPFAITGYTDTLFGIFSVVMLLLLHTESRFRNGKLLSLLPLAILICCANFFTAPQNMLYLLALLPLLLLFSLKIRPLLKNCVFWSACLIVAALVAVPQGGMLTPKSMQTLGDVPGLMSTSNSGETKLPGIHLVPGVPFHFGWGGDWKSGQNGYLKEAKIYLEHPKLNLMPLLWIIEQLFFTSLRILFFPIAGLIAIFLIWRKAGIPSNTQHYPITPSHATLSIFGIYTFLIGFLIDFTLLVNGYKWELSRFMIPGILIGMLGFSLYAIGFVDRNLKKGRYFLAATVFIMICGPIVNLFATTAKNITDTPGSPSMAERIKYFNGAGPTIEQNYCRIRLPVHDAPLTAR